MSGTFLNPNQLTYPMPPSESQLQYYDESITPYKQGENVSYTDNYGYAQTDKYIDVASRYQLYQGTVNDLYLDFYSQKSIDYMSDEITFRLRGVHPDNKNIIVPDVTIRSVADSVFEHTVTDVQILRQMTIMYIVNQIKGEYQTTKQNDALNIWVTQYTLDYGLQQIDTQNIKINKRRPTWNFNWNY